jgi:hypothetical protein
VAWQKAGLSAFEIARSLRRQNVREPSGFDWTADRVVALLKRFRLPLPRR